MSEDFQEFDPGFYSQGESSVRLELQEPVMHAPIGGPLMEDHWLLNLWAEDEDVGDRVMCEQCGRDIYDREKGRSLTTWIETGRLVDEHGDPSAQAWCLSCFATSGSVWPDMYEWWALFKGGPQPVWSTDVAMSRDELRTQVLGNIITWQQEMAPTPVADTGIIDPPGGEE